MVGYIDLPSPSAVEGGPAGSFSVEAIGLEVLVDKIRYLTQLDNGVGDESWMTTRINNYSLERLATIQACGI